MAFIAAISIYAILMVVTVTFLQMTESDLNISVNQRDTSKALYVAEGGIEYGIYKILADWDWAGAADVSLGDGKFTVSVTELGDGRKELTSTGTSTQALAMGKILTSKRKIKVTINPTAFKYAVFSNRRVRFTAVGGTTGTVTGDVHSNTTVSAGARVTVYGTVTQGSPTVFIPDVDMAAYFNDPRRTLPPFATLTITSANDDTLGNMVVYCTGNITINSNSGAVTLNGTTLVAEGNIVIQGSNNITITPDSEPLADTAYPSMVTEDGDIYTTATGPGTFTGYLYTDLLIYTKNGYINIHNLRMDGSVMSGYSAGAIGLTLRNTSGRSWSVTYDSSILENNKPKYFTQPVDAASLLWKEVD